MTELVDFRGKLTKDTDSVLYAICHASGRDKSELVREVMAGWARDRLHEAETLVRLTRKEGNRSGGDPA